MSNRLQELAGIPSDVAALGKAQSSASTVQNKAKTINNIQEFPGAFENWFKTLGFQPGKISKSAVRSEVEKVLTKLGYK
jgi:predicted ATPase